MIAIGTKVRLTERVREQWDGSADILRDIEAAPYGVVISYGEWIPYRVLWIGREWWVAMYEHEIEEVTD